MNNPKPKHTPGPWRISNVLSNRLQIGVKGEEIAALQYGENKEANAHLIAAAPEMLEALHLAVGHLEQRQVLDGVKSHRTNTLKVLNAAIAKAEGRES